MKRELITILRSDFLAFARKALRELDGTTISDDAYVEYVATQLMKVADHAVKRLLMNLPPRHLKTQIGAVCLAAWVLAHTPNTKILLVTYSEELAKHIARSIRSILMAPWYQTAFDTRVKKGQAEAMHFATTAGGAVYSASITGSITGFGADLIIVDDVHNLADAGNLGQLQRNIQLFQKVVMTRLNNPKSGRVVVIAHRVHDEDLSSKLLARGGWTAVVLPMIATRDERFETAYGPWRRRKGTVLREESHDIDDVERLRETLVNPSFDLLFQQDADGQSLPSVRPEDFRWFSADSLPSMRHVLSVDTASGKNEKNSFSVVQVWGYDGRNFYLLEQFRDHYEFNELARLVRKLGRRYRHSNILIEEAAIGSALVSELTRKQCQRLHGTVPRGSKASRYRPHIDKILQGQVWLPEGCEFGSCFIQELVDFPHGRHTDQVDAFAQVMVWIDENGQDTQASGTGASADVACVVGLNSQYRRSPQGPDGSDVRYIGKSSDRGIMAVSATSKQWRY